MIYHSRAALLALGCFTLVLIGPSGAQPAAAQTQSRPAAEHRVAIQIATNEPATMTLALNNAQNVLAHYKSANQSVEVVIVGYGPGLHMFRSDTSPVKTRIATMALENPNLIFNACGNTQVNMAKAEAKEIPLIGEAKVVPSGVVTLMELQKAGYAYIRP